MRLLRLLNKAARTLGYSQYPNKNVGFLGVVPSSQNLLRACSSSCSSMITESVPPSSQPYLSTTEIKEFGCTKFQDHGFFPVVGKTVALKLLERGTGVTREIQEFTLELKQNHGEEDEEFLIGGRIKLEYMEDPRLIKIANIAVELFNKYQNSGAYVEFLRVRKASKRYISGCIYSIILEGIDHGAGVKREYRTKVWITMGKKWKLESFEPTDNGWKEVGAASDPCGESKQDPLV